MARIQTPRIRAITERRRGWQPTPRPRVGVGQNRPAPSGSPTPSPGAHAPVAAPSITPPEADPGYLRIKQLLEPTLNATRQNVDARKHGLLTEYGLGPAVNPLTGQSYDYSANNPQSAAAKLQRSFERGMRGATNSLAARGLRRSGAMDRQTRERGNELVGARTDMERRLTSGLLGLEGEYTAAQRDIAARLADALGGAIDRQAANAAPAVPGPPPAAVTPLPSSVGTASILGKPQPGGRTAGKGKQKVGVGGAQKVRQLRMKSRWG